MIVYFHIGQPKAGSTSVQSYLIEHRDALAAEGYFVPVAMTEVGGSNNLLKEDSEKDFAQMRETLEEARTQGAHSVILSSEFAIRHFEQLLLSHAFRLRTLLETFGARLRLVCIARSGMRAALSGYAQAVINTSKLSMTFEEVDACLPRSPMSDTSFRIQKTATALKAETVTFVPMVDGWRRTALAELGLTGRELPASSRNTRLPDVMLEIYRQHNAQNPDPSQSVHFTWVMVSALAQDGLSPPAVLSRRAKRFNRHHAVLEVSYFDRFQYQPNWPLSYTEDDFQEALTKLRTAYLKDTGA